MKKLNDLRQDLQYFALISFKGMSNETAEKKVLSSSYAQLNKMTDIDKYLTKAFELFQNHLAKIDIDFDRFASSDSAYHYSVGDSVICNFDSEEQLCAKIIEIIELFHNELILNDNTVYNEDSSTNRPCCKEKFNVMPFSEFLKELAIFAFLINKIGYPIGTFVDTPHVTFEASPEIKKAYEIYTKNDTSTERFDLDKLTKEFHDITGTKAKQAGLIYGKNYDDTIIVRGYKGNSIYIVIPNTIDNKRVSKIEGIDKINTSSFNNEIKGLVVLANNYDIGFYTLNNCPNLKTFYSEGQINDLDNSSFLYCKNLLTEENGFVYLNVNNNPHYALLNTNKSVKKYKLHDDCKLIAQNAFHSSAISEIDLNNVETIGSSAFNCSSLQQILIPDSCKTINKSAFESCMNLKTIHIGSGMEIIKGFTFNNCTALEKVTLGKNIKRIDMCAFGYSVSLKEIAIPQNVDYISPTAFSKNDAIKIKLFSNAKIEINSLTPYYENVEVIENDEPKSSEPKFDERSINLLKVLTDHDFASEKTLELACQIIIIKPEKIDFLIELIESGKTESTMQLVMQTIIDVSC